MHKAGNLFAYRHFTLAVFDAEHLFGLSLSPRNTYMIFRILHELTAKLSMFASLIMPRIVCVL